MSLRDREFIRELKISQSQIASILNVTRQAINRGVSSNIDYLNQERIPKIQDILVNEYGLPEENFYKLIEKYYPNQVYIESESPIRIVGDVFFLSHEFNYFLSCNQKTFFDIKKQLGSKVIGKLFFVFAHKNNIEFNKQKIRDWLDDPELIKRCDFFVCPSVELLPFSILGEGEKSLNSKNQEYYSYYVAQDKLFEQPARYSKKIVLFFKKYIKSNSGLVMKMFND